MRSGDYDLLWIQAELLPWLPPWGEETLARRGIRMVVDYDDAIFLHYETNKSRWVRALLKDKIDRVMKWASLVIVGNDYLKRRALDAGARWVEELPSVVDITQYCFAESSSQNGLTIGWIGSPPTRKYLRLIQPALHQFCQEENARLLCIGGGTPDLEGVPLVVTDWSEETQALQLSRCDVGIMPLSKGPWEQGKCGYKLIQYMACGLPVVASPVGFNSRIVIPGENGFLASDTDEWLGAFKTLCGDPKLRKVMGNAGRTLVERSFSMQVTAPRLVNLLAQVAA
jgi:glycosyltransferase involved in cell wall biosynthesis